MITSRTLFGLLLIAFGALFLLDQSGAIDAGHVIGTWWPLILIVPALVQLAYARAFVIGPTIVLIVGLAFLAGELDILPAGAGQLFWPLVLVAIGVWILLGRGSAHGLPNVLRGNTSTSTEDTINTLALFGASNTVSHSTHFERATLTAFFGGSSLDLRQAALAPGGAVIDATAVFGGIEIFIPAGWRAASNGMGIFGGFDDKTAGDAPLATDAPTLTVRGLALFGGVEIKHKK